MANQDDFLSTLTADPVTPRQVTVGDQTGTVWFKRITAGQRSLLLKGQRVSSKVGDGSGSSMEIDLGDNERQRHMLVHFSVVTEEGKPRWRSLADVEALPSRVVSALYQHASDINSDAEGEPGKG